MDRCQQLGKFYFATPGKAVPDFTFPHLNRSCRTCSAYAHPEIPDRTEPVLSQRNLSVNNKLHLALPVIPSRSFRHSALTRLPGPV